MPHNNLTQEQGELFNRLQCSMDKMKKEDKTCEVAQKDYEEAKTDIDNALKNLGREDLVSVFTATITVGHHKEKHTVTLLGYAILRFYDSTGFDSLYPYVKDIKEAFSATQKIKDSNDEKLTFTLSEYSEHMFHKALVPTIKEAADGRPRNIGYVNQPPKPAMRWSNFFSEHRGKVGLIALGFVPIVFGIIALHYPVIPFEVSSTAIAFGVLLIFYTVRDATNEKAVKDGTSPWKAAQSMLSNVVPKCFKSPERGTA
ncbi:hypothetical protein [Wolbachia endosymbiont of Ctenocephalides felis wCfeT]|uniref:hypothetical protein n=1 Tax=Wolbachia endosymbiont of Ctenocephalides felis wCfeT TaxID=2732593 RepID=UPI0014486CD2|nr:hypothetical protein [Wolbachia endosymbiont of Ctenocephalides felis wCfeT]